MLAMTFDDGPSEYTNELLVLLAKENIKATFHIVVKYLTIRRNLDIVRNIYENGHEIGIRLDPDLKSMNADVVQKSLIANVKFIEKYFNFRPKFVRIPYSPVESPIVSVIEQAGFIVTQHNLDSYDCNYRIYVDDIVSNFELSLKNVQDGGDSFISVQRDKVYNSVIATHRIAKIARKNKYQFVTLSECLGIEEETD